MSAWVDEEGMLGEKMGEWKNGWEKGCEGE